MCFVANSSIRCGLVESVKQSYGIKREMLTVYVTVFFFPIGTTSFQTESSRNSSIISCSLRCFTRISFVLSCFRSRTWNEDRENESKFRGWTPGSGPNVPAIRNADKVRYTVRVASVGA